MLLEYDDFIYEPDYDDLDKALAKLFGKAYEVEPSINLVKAFWDMDIIDNVYEQFRNELTDYFYDKAMAQKQEEQENADYFKQVEKDYWSDIL